MIEARLDQRETELQRGIAMVNGDGARTPSQSVAVFTGLDAVIGSDIESADALLTRYNDEDRESLNGVLAPLYSSAQAMRQRLESVRSGSREYASNARSLVAQAQTFRQDGERLYNEAQAALAQDNFERARERLLNAGNRYDASLQIEDNTDLRRTRDTILPQLDAEISRLENEAVIRQVNELIASARTDYYGGDFDAAERKFTTAQNLWQTTQSAPNQDIRNWLNIISSALSSRSGRTIPPTAPLYAEMSQLLSDARKNYDEGMSYFNTNRRGEGLARFSNAREKTQKVKLMYPLNEDAGLLELRMDREQDPRSFDANFDVRLQTARAGTLRQDWQSYADMLNLFVINPNYPNRERIITQAQIDMRILPPPPDPAKIAESNSLAAQARAILNTNTNNEIQLRQAQDLVNRALESNPDNNEAARLASDVAMRLGGPRAMFDYETEQKFVRAGEFLQQNRPLDAYALANEIADDPRYRNNSRLLDLLQRIRVSL
jgi:hypothetical protein